MDLALANCGASKNWEDIVPSHQPISHSPTDWFDDWCQACARLHAGVNHSLATGHFLKALFTSNAYEEHLNMMLFKEAKKNGKFLFLEALCFISLRLVTKKRTK